MWPELSETFLVDVVDVVGSQVKTERSEALCRVGVWVGVIRVQGDNQPLSHHYSIVHSNKCMPDLSRVVVPVNTRLVWILLLTNTGLPFHPHPNLLSVPPLNSIHQKPNFQ